LSALGWGIAVGGTITAVSFPIAALRKSAGLFFNATLGASVFLGLVVGLMPIPWYGFWAFMAPAFAIPLAVFLGGRKLVEEKAAEEQAARVASEMARAERKARCEAAIVQKDAHFQALREVWPAQNNCVFEGAKGVFGMNSDSQKICLATYHLDEIFEPIMHVEIGIEKIFSASVKWSDVQETYYRTELVPIAIKNKKSPVARGLVGGVLLGPAGLVLGAASGLGGKATIVTEERKVRDQRTVKGKPVLFIGTTDPSYPSIKLSFVSDNVPEHWLNQIRAAKARAGQILQY